MTPIIILYIACDETTNEVKISFALYEAMEWMKARIKEGHEASGFINKEFYGGYETWDPITLDDERYVCREGRDNRCKRLIYRAASGSLPSAPQQ